MSQFVAVGNPVHREPSLAFFPLAGGGTPSPFAKSQNPGSLLAQAVTERKLGHFAGALKLYRTYLALPANVKVTPEWKKKAETEAAECEKSLCRLDVRADSFSVDGTPEVGVVFAEPGTHAVSMVGKAERSWSV
jgi:hypothetical protein